MSTQPKPYLTPAEYLAIERKAEQKSEYYQGETFAMAGASRAHNLIALNIGSELRDQFKGRPCEAYTSDMRVKVDPSGLYTYPDVVAACQPLRFEDAETDTLLNPRLIVEVLSKSTSAYDRGPKAEMCRQLDSLQEYLLVEQDRMHVEHYVRGQEGTWQFAEHNEAASVVQLESIDCRLAIAAIYEKVDFSQAERAQQSGFP